MKLAWKRLRATNSMHVGWRTLVRTKKRKMMEVECKVLIVHSKHEHELCARAKDRDVCQDNDKQTSEQAAENKQTRGETSKELVDLDWI